MQPFTRRGKTILLTGASSRQGIRILRALARDGHTVFAATTDLDGTGTPKSDTVHQEAFYLNGRVRPVELDVRSQASVDATVALAESETGRLDVIIHNAEQLARGAAEAFTPEQLATLFDDNVLGAHRVNVAALPRMREQESGLLVWLGSTTTRGGHPPFMGPYTATKAASDLLAQSYALELTRFGIESTIVLTSKVLHVGDDSDSVVASDARIAEAYSRYDDVVERIPARLATLCPGGVDPNMVAEEVRRIVDLPVGRRPFRVVIDPLHDGAQTVTEVAERVRTAFARRLGISELLHPRL